MKHVSRSSKPKDGEDGEKCQKEPEVDQEVSNTHTAETEDDGPVDEKDQIQSEDDPVSELMDIGQGGEGRECRETRQFSVSPTSRQNYLPQEEGGRGS